MDISIKNAPQMVKNWLAKTEEVTGLSRTAIITANLLDIASRKSERNTPSKGKVATEELKSSTKKSV